MTYRIEPHFIGSANPRLTVTYEVLGGEDGPQINSFKVDASGNAAVEDEESISTASSTSVLRAKVTDVLAG